MLTEPALASAVAGVPFMSPEQGRTVYDHVRGSGARDVLELGTAHGVGAAYMAQALEDAGTGHLTTVDHAGAAFDPAPEAVLVTYSDHEPAAVAGAAVEEIALHVPKTTDLAAAARAVRALPGNRLRA